MNTIRQNRRAAALVSGAALAAIAFTACDDGPAEPGGPSGITIVSGAGVTDTIDALLTAPLLVEVRNVRGDLAANAEVRFDVLPLSPTPIPANSRPLFICQGVVTNCATTSFAMTLTDTTDASGRASMFVRLGRVAGPATLQVSVPALGFVDTVSYTVNAGAPSAVRTTDLDVSLAFGATATLNNSRVTDRLGNTRADVPTLTAGAGNSISLNPTTRVVTALAMGEQVVRYQFASLVDSSIVRVVPPGRLVAVTGNQIRMLNTDGSNLRTLVPAFDAGIFGLGQYPRFDPARQRVSYSSGNNVGQTDASVVDTATLALRTLGIAAGLNSILATRVLADGSLLVLAQRNSLPGYSLFRVAQDNSLTSLVAVPGLVSIRGIADISPDGAQIVYGVNSAPSGLPQLRIITVATGAVRTFEQGIGFPRWSRNGDQIAFIANDGLATINADGSGRRLVTAHPSAGPLTWSSDGAYIIDFANNLLRIVRVADGVKVGLRYRSAAGAIESYREPDWR